MEAKGRIRERKEANGKSSVSPQQRSQAAAPEQISLKPESLGQEEILYLQREVGNQAVTQLLEQRGGAAETTGRIRQPQLHLAASTTPVVQRSFWGNLKKGFSTATGAVGDAARWTWGKTVQGAEAVGRGAKWAGNKTIEGAKWTGEQAVAGANWVGDQAVKGAKAVGQAAKWAGNKTVAGAKWAGDKAVQGAKAAGRLAYDGRYKDLNGTQYRITSNKIELVRRVEREDGSVGYLAVGEVTGYEGNRPLIAHYPAPVDLGSWAPRVTHINGMNVKPQSGIQDAQQLHGLLAAEVSRGGEVDLSEAEEEKLAVLYTYSATRGFGRDLIECLGAKVGLDDEVTGSQETLMLDAVRRRQRVTVSAHSRGTIKTDNAVRNAHRTLSAGFQGEMYESAEARQAAEEARAQTDGFSQEAMIDPEILADIARQVKARALADARAAEEMDAYVHLIYAGNAVQFPSKVVKLDLVVAKGDMVTIMVGKYTKLGLGEKAKMTDVSGGHGFGKNYAQTVSALIIEDMRQAGE